MSDLQWRSCPVCAAPLVERFAYGTLRPVCSTCSFVLFLNPKVVAVVVVRDGDKFLLGRRNVNPGKGLWSFFGGYVECGEQVEEAAIREVKEETNLDIHLERLIGVYSEKGDPHILIVYQARVIEGQRNSWVGQPEEVSELALFGWEELPALAFPVDLHILDDWKRLNSEVSC